jgi:small GTP-binding protein
MRLLTQNQNELVSKIRTLLVDFLAFRENNKINQQNISLIKDLIIQLDDLFLIVIVGEYNSGKSAFINALLGKNILETGVTPTTSNITILRHGIDLQETNPSPGLTLIKIPNSILEDISLVDTPGTNAILREHEALTTDFIPRSDLVLFITSVDRPFTESERQFLELIKDWGKKVVVVINKTDIITSEKDLQQIIDYVSLNTKTLLGVEPPVFTISAKDALKRKVDGKTSESDFQRVEDYIYKILSPSSQLALKLSNPLGVLSKLIAELVESTNEKIALISNDVQLLSDLESQISLFREDMLRSFKFHYAEIDNSLLEFEKRGINFFENTFRIARIMDLINKDKIQSEYNAMVVKGLPAEIDNKVSNLIEWLVDEDLKQWQSITNKIDQRILKYQDRVFDDPETRKIRFERFKIIEAVKRESQRIVEQFDKDDESKRIAEDAQMAVAASAAIEVGALGLGALITILATTASADFTGVMLAGLTAVLGFFIIPAKKKQAKVLFTKRIANLRDQLSDTLMAEFIKQIDVIIERINTTIQPYSRFVRSEQISLNKNVDTLHSYSDAVFSLKEETNKI